MDPWLWICELPESPESDSDAVFHLAGSPPSHDKPTRSIQLIAERTSGSNPGSPSLTFKVMLQGFHRVNSPGETIWVSDTCTLSSDKPFLPLVLQILRELISISPTPTGDVGACGNSRLREIKPDPVCWVMDSHSPESFSCVFNLIFLTRLFWLCVCDAPSEIGSFFFHNLFEPHMEALTRQRAPVLRTFLVAVGIDAELCITRAASYALAKWLISKEVGMGLKQLSSLPRHQLGFSYATEAHGLWVLKGHFPTMAMSVTNSNNSSDYYKITKFPIMDPKETVLRYALSHQQAEAVVQFEYSVKFHENYIRVSARVDNIRIHVAKLGFHKGGEIVVGMDYSEERYFPTRVRVWVGPEIGSAHVTGLSLGRSTNNEEREVEVTRVLKGTFGKVKVPRVKARARMSTRTKLKDWKIEQDCEGNDAVFDAILYDRETGGEVAAAATRPCNYEGDHNNYYEKGYFKNVFTKNGGIVFGGDEYGDEVTWRIGREMEGSVLKWRIGGQIWLSYWPNKLNSSFHETRFVEWCDEVDLPLVPTS